MSEMLSRQSSFVDIPKKQRSKKEKVLVDAAAQVPDLL